MNKLPLVYQSVACQDAVCHQYSQFHASRYYGVDVVALEKTKGLYKQMIFFEILTSTRLMISKRN